ncbi:MAG: DUF1475 family protein [Isosphaeraceae bacterium]
MKAIFLGLFGAILLLMLAVTAWASWLQPLWEAGYLFDEPWFVATFLDAYCGFLTFYAWVVYKERSGLARAGWFLAIMGLGNIAMAAYMLLQLCRQRRGDSWEQLFLRRQP